MRLMGLEAIYPKPHLSRNDAEHRIYPYLLRNVAIVRPNQVWSSDITFVPMPHGWMYLTVVMDWYSRYVLSWRLSNTLDGLFCLEALEEALTRGTPEIFNTDQGVQYTATAFTDRLELAGVAISMDGRGRWMDNVFVERLWRTVKYEYIYLHDHATPRALEAGLAGYFPFYNDERIARGLGLPHAGDGVRGGVRRCQRSHGSGPNQTKSLETNWEIHHVLITVGRLCGRAKPLEWVSRAASPLYLRIRNQWSRQPGPPQSVFSRRRKAGLCRTRVARPPRWRPSGLLAA